MPETCHIITPSKECHCDYIPPVVEKLLIRINKKGVWQVKINGKGKWIDAEYNKEKNTIVYLA